MQQTIKERVLEHLEGAAKEARRRLVEAQIECDRAESTLASMRTVIKDFEGRTPQ